MKSLNEFVTEGKSTYFTQLDCATICIHLSGLLEKSGVKEIDDCYKGYRDNLSEDDLDDFRMWDERLWANLYDEGKPIRYTKSSLGAFAKILKDFLVHCKNNIVVDDKVGRLELQEIINKL